MDKVISELRPEKGEKWAKEETGRQEMQEGRFTTKAAKGIPGWKVRGIPR